MMSEPLTAADIIDTAFEVCTVLDRDGTKAVLTGGSAATLYAQEAYISGDLDFVLMFGAKDRPSAVPLQEIGFVAEADHYRRDRLIVEFPKGPLAIGCDLISAYETLHRGKEVLYALSVTDAVRNRLIAYYSWNDFSALAAAVAIYERHGDGIDGELIRQWTKREYSATRDRQIERYNSFVEALADANVSYRPKPLR